MINNDHNHNCNDDKSEFDDLSIGNQPNIHNNNLLFSNDSVGDADDEMEDEDVPQTLTDAMYKSYLIKTFNQKTLNNFHPLYPLRVINWCPNTRTPFKLIEESCLNANNKITHLKQYRKLFYKFGTLTEHTQTRDVCNLCNQHIDPNTNAMEKHIFVDCTHLNHLRSNYWKQAHNELVNIYNQPYNTHQQKFAQYVLESIQKLTIHKNNFWKIASGANSVKINKQTFQYDLFWHNYIGLKTTITKNEMYFTSNF